MTKERLKVFARFVEELTTLSKCTDRGVAAIITDKDGTQVFSIGVNGGPKGGMDCLCKLGGKYSCAHAEANALAKCKVDCADATMICSLSPCVTCATLIINAGISTVYFLHSYKDNTGLDMLSEAGIRVFDIADVHLSENPMPDYVKEFFDKSSIRIPANDDRMLQEIQYYCKKYNKSLRVVNSVSTLEKVCTIN